MGCYMPVPQTLETQGFNTPPVHMGFRPPRVTCAPNTFTCLKYHVQAQGRRHGSTFLRSHNQISEASFETGAQKKGMHILTCFSSVSNRKVSFETDQLWMLLM
jgi:hypothetical protein